ncbi:hypothetical protein PHISP_02838 [Aspergillus sp. HF37]|nr:hypothetical protein PHISP_02838 [Aspergillus sp. HF37]
MVVFVDHDVLDPDPSPQDPPSCLPAREDPNQGAFSAALNCYPCISLPLSTYLILSNHPRIVTEIARSLDLNTLHALSQTCRLIHTTIAPFGPQLAHKSLRCENEYIEALSDLLETGAAVPDSVKLVARLLGENPDPDSPRLTRGKVGKCARDMVAECRRCARVNCTIKAPSSSLLKNRIRRLCSTCQTAPLARLLSLPDPVLPLDLARNVAASAFMRSPCACADVVWLCYQCGHALRSADAAYHRAWTYPGGVVGEGHGEGGRQVVCGRHEDCLAADVIGGDDDCEASSSSIQPGFVGIRRASEQDIMKITDGACVVEYEDEVAEGRYLAREEEGRHRSWCGWCWRVIPSLDEDALTLC